MGLSAASKGPIGPDTEPDKNLSLAAERGRQHLERLLRTLAREGASDLHLVFGSAPTLRVQGELLPIAAQPPLTAELLETFADVLIAGRDRAAFHRTGAIDGALTGPENTRLRFNVFRSRGHISIALRRLEEKTRTLAELGLPESLYELCQLSDGLVVVAGPTGAGKSTTLATLIDRINESRRCHIVTVEDPIEYLHAPRRAVINQREIGSDASSFGDAVVAALRQDPDVILLGEVRDLRTIRTAIIAAETGHLVFTTVHAGDCVGAVERLVSVFPGAEQDGIRRQLSLVLRAIITQHLIVADGPRSAPGPAAPPLVPRHPRDSEFFILVEDLVGAAARDGAASEGGSRGPFPQDLGALVAEARPARRRQVVASEVLIATPAVANLIASAKSAQIASAMETGRAFGMQTLEQDLARLWSEERISEAAALALSRNPALVRDRYQALRGARKRAPGSGR